MGMQEMGMSDGVWSGQRVGGKGRTATTKSNKRERCASHSPLGEEEMFSGAVKPKPTRSRNMCPNLSHSRWLVQQQQQQKEEE